MIWHPAPPKFLVVDRLASLWIVRASVHLHSSDEASLLAYNLRKQRLIDAAGSVDR